MFRVSLYLSIAHSFAGSIEAVTVGASPAGVIARHQTIKTIYFDFLSLCAVPEGGHVQARVRRLLLLPFYTRLMCLEIMMGFLYYEFFHDFSLPSLTICHIA
jgi:hypothetical protein